MRITSRFRAAAFAVAFATVPGAAHAHGDGLDARGTIVEASPSRIVVRTPEGATKPFAVTEATEVRRGAKPAKIGDVATGERAVVHARKAPQGDPIATSIRLAREREPGK